MKIYVFLIFAISIGVTFFLSNLQVFAEDATPSASTAPTATPDPNQERLSDLQGQIGDLEKKLTDTQAQKKTLSSEINVMDSQIKL
ncbi:MAG: hypothetical protein HY429_02295, partial [Candidatus Levybacteria bacterium]|nr:hypothetical protein [Candidatus Levybacteria bacterium]